MASSNIEGYVSDIENFDDLPPARQNELLVYYKTVIVGAESVTAAELDELRGVLHLSAFRTAQDLSERANKGSKPLRYVKKARGYALERRAREEVRAFLEKRPAAKRISKALEDLLGRVPEGPRREYLEEAIGCFNSRFLRASLVLTWCVVYDVFREWLFTKHLSALNVRLATWKKPMSISRLDDFSEFTERGIIDLARDSGVIVKEDHKVLVALLDRRNSYAHITGRTISASTVEAYLEEAINDVVGKYK